jgi:hypothetical protein
MERTIIIALSSNNRAKSSSNSSSLQDKQTVPQQSLMDEVKDGFSFGLGSSMVNKIIGGIFGTGATVHHAVPGQTAAVTVEPGKTVTATLQPAQAVESNKRIEYMKCMEISDMYERTDCLMKLDMDEYKGCHK